MRPAIVDNVLKMLSCGLTVRGYAVFQCGNPECSHQKKVCFCKSRFCPTCGKKLTDQWIEEQKAILPDTKWQHITFTMPSKLWELFRYNRELLGCLSGLSTKIILKAARKKGILPGIFTLCHRGRLTNDNTAWKPLYYCKKAIMPMWRYEIITCSGKRTIGES